MTYPSAPGKRAAPEAVQRAAAARLRANRARLASLALQSALRIDPEFEARYDEQMLRLFLRDYERHMEQLARALETGDDYFTSAYAEWLVPVYRRRHVPMRDVIVLVAGLRDAAATVLTPTENEVARDLFVRWSDQLKHHGRLPGDHKGNPILRFFWKGAGIGDDKWI